MRSRGDFLYKQVGVMRHTAAYQLQLDQCVRICTIGMAPFGRVKERLHLDQ